MSLQLSFCDECYQDSFAECDNIPFVVGLDASTAYKAVITNHFGQKYTQDVTTDTGGAFELDITGFPEGFFNPYSGFFTLNVTDANGVNQTLTISYTDYDCVTFDIYSLSDANP